MNADDMKKRLSSVAVRIIRLAEALPRTRSCEILSKQLLRSGCSAGANYRAAARAKSTADFINKLKIVEEELDESQHWLELFVDAAIIDRKRIADLHKEIDELIAITVASIITARKNK